jgi:signal transduction histidine kinase
MLDGDNQAVLYSSQPGFGNIPSAADASLRLFGPPLLVRGTFFSHMPGVVFPTLAESNTPHLFIDPVMKASNGGNLTVIAQHRKGLEAAVKDLRDRNLAMNFGILGILVLTLTLVVATSQRAQMLAQMQMDFVAGVSHELRTPLTAIILAARNLEDGVVHENGLVRYGAAIKGQAAQLSELVDEILLFSETHSGRHVYKIEAVDVTLGIQTTIENLAPLIEASGFIVEEEVSPDLPLVRADAAAFTQCLQNLISNSLKYGGEKKWVGVRAFSHETAGRGEICVSVQDRGIGIKSGELKQIFEPFYRSADVASEIHGNGLGLPLTKTMVEAMGGRLTVASEPGKGSNFTIHLRPV